MTVSTSTRLTILNKVPETNKCPLKISLVGVPQEMPSEVKDDVIFKIMVTDYVGQDCDFVVNVVFQSNNPRLAHLKDTVRPRESLIFVVGQMEIVGNEFYVYAKDVNYIDTRFVIKKKSFESSLPQNSLAS